MQGCSKKRRRLTAALTTPLAFAMCILGGAVLSCGTSDEGTPPGSPGAGDPSGGGSGSGNGDGTGNGPGGTAGGGNGSNSGNGADPGSGSDPEAIINDRVFDFGEALRLASLKLVGDLPSLADIKAIAGAADDTARRALYEQKIDAMLSDARFASVQVGWWKNTFKTGNYANKAQALPSYDTAATFAAQVVVQDKPFTEILTAKTGTCPTFANNTFTAANCQTAAPVSGVLTDPGLMSQYFSNMAFRRVRFLQETFACTKFPAEYAASPTTMGSAVYTSPWKFESIAGGATAKINFQDTSSVVCANCHTTMNHVAPLFANFDANGAFNAGQIQVQTPVIPPVRSVLADWLPNGETFAWRNGVAVADIPALGQAMAKDPEVLRCAVSRVWNWALSRGDIVADGSTIAPAVTEKVVSDFSANGLNLKKTIRQVFTSDDFLKF